MSDFERKVDDLHRTIHGAPGREREGMVYKLNRLCEIEEQRARHEIQRRNAMYTAALSAIVAALSAVLAWFKH